MTTLVELLVAAVFGSLLGWVVGCLYAATADTPGSIRPAGARLDGVARRKAELTLRAVHWFAGTIRGAIAAEGGRTNWSVDLALADEIERELCQTLEVAQPPPIVVGSASVYEA